ncbi:MAG: O-antigen ligase family protein [Anaeroplasmataceae bacterium]
MNFSFKDIVKNVIESKLFILFVSFLTIVTWYFDVNFLNYTLFIFLLGCVFYSGAQGTSIISLFILMLGGERVTPPYNFNSGIFYVLIVASLFFVFFVIKDIILNYRLYFNKFKKNYLLYSMLFVVVAMLLSLINTPSIGASFGYIGKYIVNIVFFVIALMKIDINSKFNKEFVLKTVICVSFVIMIQTSILLVEYLPHMSIEQILLGKKLHLGWAHSNHYIVIVNISLPIILYFYISATKLINKITCLFLILPAIFLNLIVLSGTAFITLVVMSILGLIILLIYSKNRKLDSCILAGILVVGLLVLSIFALTNLFDILMVYLENKDFNTMTGRVELFDLAIAKFKENWFFGPGVGTAHYFIENILNRTELNYHNYILQASTFGIVGIIAFYGYISSIFVKIIRFDLFGTIFGLILIVFLVGGFLDTLFFNHRIEPVFVMLSIFLFAKPTNKIIILQKEVPLLNYDLV